MSRLGLTLRAILQVFVKPEPPARRADLESVVPIPADLAAELARSEDAMRTWNELISDQQRTAYLDWLAKQPRQRRRESLVWLRRTLAALPDIDRRGLGCVDVIGF